MLAGAKWCGRASPDTCSRCGSEPPVGSSTRVAAKVALPRAYYREVTLFEQLWKPAEAAADEARTAVLEEERAGEEDEFHCSMAYFQGRRLEAAHLARLCIDEKQHATRPMDRRQDEVPAVTEPNPVGRGSWSRENAHKRVLAGDCTAANVHDRLRHDQHSMLVSQKTPQQGRARGCRRRYRRRRRGRLR